MEKIKPLIQNHVKYENLIHVNLPDSTLFSEQSGLNYYAIYLTNI